MLPELVVEGPRQWLLLPPSPHLWLLLSSEAVREDGEVSRTPGLCALGSRGTALPPRQPGRLWVRPDPLGTKIVQTALGAHRWARLSV